MQNASGISQLLSEKEVKPHFLDSYLFTIPNFRCEISTYMISGERHLDFYISVSCDFFLLACRSQVNKIFSQVQINY